MAARKTKEKVLTKAKDIAQFTLPSPEENTSLPLLNSVPDSSGENIFSHTKSGKIWTSSFGVSIVIALIVGVFIYREGTTISAPLPAPIEEPQVSPTPVPVAVNVSKYKIEILNGSGISGEAAKIKGLFEEEKFTVSSIGNADSLNNQQTVIQAKKSVPKEYLDKLKNFLEKEYILDDIKELSDNEESDVVVTVGNKKVL